MRQLLLMWIAIGAQAADLTHATVVAAASLTGPERKAAAMLVDAVRVDLPLPQKALIHGDALCFSIAAASILAKVARDAALQAWDAVFPEYHLKDNKGHGTPEHLAALDRLGPTALHRFSFEPVRNTSRYPTWTGYPIPLPQHIPEQGELFACP